MSDGWGRILATGDGEFASVWQRAGEVFFCPANGSRSQSWTRQAARRSSAGRQDHRPVAARHAAGFGRRHAEGRDNKARRRRAISGPRRIERRGRSCSRLRIRSSKEPSLAVERVLATESGSSSIARSGARGARLLLGDGSISVTNAVQCIVANGTLGPTSSGANPFTPRYVRSIHDARLCWLHVFPGVSSPMEVPALRRP